MPGKLHIVCTSLPDFFARIERFVSALSGSVAVSLGSLGDSHAQVTVDQVQLGADEDYQRYKREALSGGAALLTSISVEQQSRAISFELASWSQGQLPVIFDPARVNRAWLSRLSECFDLKTDWFVNRDAESVTAEGRDAAYLHAVRHFEESAAKVNDASHEAAVAVREFLAQAAKQMTTWDLKFEESLASEQRDRQNAFAQHLLDSDQLDVRQHGLVRRSLIDDMKAITDQALVLRESDETLETRKQIARLCWGGMLGGSFLVLFGLLVALPSLSDLLGGEIERLSPTLFVISGLAVVMISAGVCFWHLFRIQLRHEKLDQSSRTFKRDLLRMAWLSELYLDAVDKQQLGEDAAMALPPILVERFSKSLFTGESVERTELGESFEEELEVYSEVGHAPHDASCRACPTGYWQFSSLPDSLKLLAKPINQPGRGEIHHQIQPPNPSLAPTTLAA